MSTCPHCSAEIGDCDSCEELVIEADMIYCQFCNNQYCPDCAEDNNICDECGRPICGTVVCYTCKKEKDFDKMYTCEDGCGEYYCKKCAKIIKFKCSCDCGLVLTGEI